MSEAVQTFHDSQLEQLADEIHSEHVSTFKHRDREDFTHSSYPGLKSSANRMRMSGKYAGCTYVRVTGGVARQLTASEVKQFQRYVRWCMGIDPLPEPRKRRAVV